MRSCAWANSTAVLDQARVMDSTEQGCPKRSTSRRSAQRPRIGRSDGSPELANWTELAVPSVCSTASTT